MAGSSFGTVFRVTTWGESHGPGLGAVLDGVPAGLPLTEEMIQRQLDRRRPGQSRYATKRKESDQVHILSGVFEGRTTGTSLSLAIWNEDQHSRDYANVQDTYRPGHADFTYDQKYGFRDYRGGGRSSGRETAARVAAGAVAEEILKSIGVQVTAYTRSIGPVESPVTNLAEAQNNPLCMPDAKAAAEAAAFLETRMAERDSAGGVIECVVTGLPTGIGDPVFEKLDARLGKAIFSIGAVKGVEIGDGFAVSSSRGSADNDGFRPEGSAIVPSSNHAGGILGGISDAAPIILRAAIKPTPSIFQPQATVHRDGTPTELVLRGRHDPVIVPRAVVVVESMTAITLVDSLFLNMSARMDRFEAFYHQN